MKSIKMIGIGGTNTARVILLASGLGVIAIAAMILFAPDAFYGGYGIELGGNASLANELKAPAGALLVAGLLMFAGVIRRDLVAFSLTTGAVVYLSYGLSRLVSMATDGMPHANLVSAAGIEIVIGAVCLLTLVGIRRRNPQ